MTDIKDQHLWYAINQMRRMARTLQLSEGSMSPGMAESMKNIYIPGLDLCADECEKVLSKDFEK